MSLSRAAQSVVHFAVLFSVLGCGGGGDAPIELKGAGASFPAPLYQRWFAEYSGSHGVKVEYASAGSGAGIKQFTEKLVDFGASDAAMTDEEMAKVEEGVQLLPMTAGSIVMCYNLNDAKGKPIADLKLSRAAYAAIFLGEVSNWNDAAIAENNPNVQLPNKPISVVYRSDSSGTTFVFTQHLSAVSEKWKNGPGADKTVKWPVGSGAPKNDGVAGAVKQNEGAIGYVEFGFASKTGITMASLQNKSGRFAAPTLETATAALNSIPELPPDLRAWLPDPEGDNSYPIVSFTWILCRKKNPDPKRAEALKHLLMYCLTDGQKVSEELGYIPLPANVSQRVISALDNITSGGGNNS